MVDKPARRQKRMKKAPKPPSKPLTAREKLLAAGILVTELGVPDDLEPISDEEIAEIGHLEPGGKSSDEIIREGRGIC